MIYYYKIPSINKDGITMAETKEEAYRDIKNLFQLSDTCAIGITTKFSVIPTHLEYNLDTSKYKGNFYKINNTEYLIIVYSDLERVYGLTCHHINLLKTFNGIGKFIFQINEKYFYTYLDSFFNPELKELENYELVGKLPSCIADDMMEASDDYTKYKHGY